MNKREIGNKYEDMATGYLKSKGYIIVDRNYYSPRGEIDIIALDGEYTCFIEVKYRSNTYTGYPTESITPYKIRRITNTANDYIMRKKISFDTPCRFDVVSILDDEITLFKNAFDGIWYKEMLWNLIILLLQLLIWI